MDEEEKITRSKVGKDRRRERDGIICHHSKVIRVGQPPLKIDDIKNMAQSERDDLKQGLRQAKEKAKQANSYAKANPDKLKTVIDDKFAGQVTRLSPLLDLFQAEINLFKAYLKGKLDEKAETILEEVVEISPKVNICRFKSYLKAINAATDVSIAANGLTDILLARCNFLDGRYEDACRYLIFASANSRLVTVAEFELEIVNGTTRQRLNVNASKAERKPELNEIINGLALEQGHSAKDLWQKFVGTLDEQQFAPKEGSDSKGNLYCDYTNVSTGKKSRIKFVTFQNRLSRTKPKIHK